MAKSRGLTPAASMTAAAPAKKGGAARHGITAHASRGAVVARRLLHRSSLWTVAPVERLGGGGSTQTLEPFNVAAPRRQADAAHRGWLDKKVWRHLMARACRIATCDIDGSHTRRQLCPRTAT